MNIYIEELLNLSNKAQKKQEVPVSAIIVYKNKIIAKAYNKRIKNNSVLEHAEITAIKKASKKMKDWRLDECDMYITLEPCDMCKEIIKASRIRNVFYLINRLENKKKYNKTSIKCIENEYKDLANIYRENLSSFFKEKRRK